MKTKLYIYTIGEFAEALTAPLYILTYGKTTSSALK